MKTIGRVVFAMLVGSLMIVGAAARTLALFISAGATKETREDDLVGHENLFGPGHTEGDGFTVYGREPVVAGRNGEPVGAYSGEPIIHY